MKKFSSVAWVEFVIFWILFALGSSVVVFLNLSPAFGEQQFVYQAYAFLQGQLHFIDQPGTWNDAVPLNGKYYWPLGPFPSIPLLPLVAVFKYTILQGYVQLVLNAGIFFFTYAIAKRFQFSKTTALWLAFGFFFSSVYLWVGAIQWSWYYAQVVTVFFSLWALYEYFHNRRWWLIGLCIACVLATRMGAALQIVFFLLTLFSLSESRKQKLIHVIQLCLPVILSAGILLYMNDVRFGDPWNNGYLLQDIGGVNELKRELYGLFHVSNVLPNLFRYFFWIPYIFPWGDDGSSIDLLTTLYPASFFLISPLFLWMFRAPKRHPLTWKLVAGVLPTLSMLMVYYASGTRLGPRYMADILPLLFVLLLLGIQRAGGLHPALKVLIAGSALYNIVNLFLVL